MRRTRGLIAVLLLGMGLLGGFLAVVAQDASWPTPPPLKPLPRGMVAPTVVPVRDVQDANTRNSQVLPASAPEEDPLPLEPGEQKKIIESNVLPATSPDPVVVTTPDKEMTPAPLVEVREVEEPAPKPPPVVAPHVPTTSPTPRPLSNLNPAAPTSLPLDPGPIQVIETPGTPGNIETPGKPVVAFPSAAPIKNVEPIPTAPVHESASSPGLPISPGLPVRKFETKSVPAAPVHVAVPIRRSQPAAPVLQQDIISNGSNAPAISSDSSMVPRVQSPLLTIEKHGPNSVSMGQPVHYEIIVKNVGQMPASQVRVEDELPEKARFLSGSPQPVFQGGRVVWNLDEILPGGEQHLQLDLEPGTSGELSGQTSLVLTIGSQMQVTAAPLEVSIVGPGRLTKDSQGGFKIILNNRSSQRFSNVTLHAQLPAGLIHPAGKSIEADVGELAPGASRDIDLKVTAVQPGRHTLSAIITVQGRQEASAKTAVFVGEPGLVLVQQATTRLQLDRPGELSVEVANFHTRNIKNLSVTATLPEGVEFQGANEGGLHRAGLRKVQWTVENLAPEQSRTLTISVKGTIPGQFGCLVQAQAPEGLKAQVQGKVVVESMVQFPPKYASDSSVERMPQAQMQSKTIGEGRAQLTMKISHKDEPLEVGRETTYEIRVGNQGNTADSAVQIVANVPDGMMITNVDGPAHRIQGQQVVFEPLARLDSNSQVIYKVGVVAQAPGDRRFRVQMTSSNMRESVIREDRTMVYKDR